MRRLSCVGLLLMLSCAGPTARAPTAETSPSANIDPLTRPTPATTTATTPAATPRACDAAVRCFRDGREAGEVCTDDPSVTILDLHGDWAPHVFDAAPELGEVGVPPYRATYVALADEAWTRLPEDVDPESYLELFGIVPTLRVLRARLGEDSRHACHDAVDDADLLALDATLRPWSPTVDEQRARARRVAGHERFFEAERARLGLATLEELRGRTARPSSLTSFLRERTTVRAIRATQAHLVCDGLLTEGRYEAGVFDPRTSSALAVFQRRHVVVSRGALDGPSRLALTEDSREADFRAALRVLRERVVDATGVVEDGSARNAWGTVLGRSLDPVEMRTIVGREPLANGAPDWISGATEAAAQALGWLDPAATRAWLEANSSIDRLAVELPARPAYHSAHMELRAEIDRGDVWFEFPYTSAGRRVAQPVQVRPALTLYAQTPEGEVALVRWPTTIGGWKPERSRSGAIGLRYKESPAGPRIWRDVIAAPAWLPPPSTPADELARRTVDGRLVPNTSLFGPSYRSAYGLAMVMNHRVYEPRREGDAPTIADEGIRAHGSVSYGSILSGTSHGCHRLHNHLAVRLTGFLLAHRRHVRHGSMTTRYARRLSPALTLRIDSRGYRYELTPPVPVNVLPGTIHGQVLEAPDGLRPLPGRARADAQASAAASDD